LKVREWFQVTLVRSRVKNPDILQRQRRRDIDHLVLKMSDSGTVVSLKYNLKNVLLSIEKGVFLPSFLRRFVSFPTVNSDDHLGNVHIISAVWIDIQVIVMLLLTLTIWCG
jgi:hypothetical protein